MNSTLEYVIRYIKSRKRKIFNVATGSMAVILVGSSTLVEGPLQILAVIVGLANALFWAKTK